MAWRQRNQRRERCQAPRRSASSGTSRAACATASRCARTSTGPRGDGPFPVILIRLPYDKTQAENITYAHPSWYARHGYLVVAQDTRGCWASDGDFYPFRHEAEDGYDTVEWAARLPGADSRVGMYGFSYAGATQLLAATRRPPSLVTVCPGLTASQYAEGWTYNGGALALAFAASWATDLAQAKRPPPWRRRGARHLGRCLCRRSKLVLVAPFAGVPPVAERGC